MCEQHFPSPAMHSVQCVHVTVPSLLCVIIHKETGASFIRCERLTLANTTSCTLVINPETI